MHAQLAENVVDVGGLLGLITSEEAMSTSGRTADPMASPRPVT
jgi:hypothetical protein